MVIGTMLPIIIIGTYCGHTPNQEKEGRLQSLDRFALAQLTPTKE